MALMSGFRLHIRSTNDAQILAWKLIRLLGSLSLFGLSIVSVVSDVDESNASTVIPHPRKRGRYLVPHPRAVDDFKRLTAADGVNISFIVFYAYASALAVWALVAPFRRVFLIHLHLGLVLFTAWTTFVYRDVWPLATYTLEPEDKAEGKILWTRISIVAVMAIVIPLFVPNRYVPTDPEVSS